MSARKLPRELGVILRCDHVGACAALWSTGNVRVRANRSGAARDGWLSKRVGRRWLDWCNEHAEAERRRAELEETARVAARAERRELAIERETKRLAKREEQAQRRAERAEKRRTRGELGAGRSEAVAS